MAMERDLPSESGETGLKPDYQLGREKGQEEEEGGGGGGGGRRRRMRKRRRGQRACESRVEEGAGGSASPIFKVGTCAMPQMAWSWFRPKKGDKACNQNTRQFFLPMTYHLPYHSHISVPETRSTVYK